MKIGMAVIMMLIFLTGCEQTGLAVRKPYPEQWRGVAFGDDIGFRKLDSLKDEGVIIADTLGGTAVILPADVFFSEQVDRVVINPNFQPVLNQLVYILKGYPKGKISVIGHSDDVMNKALQQKQSQAYAAAIAEYLTAAGISPLRIQSVNGVGATQPIFDNESSFEDRQMNRRVEVISALPLK